MFSCHSSADPWGKGCKGVFDSFLRKPAGRLGVVSLRIRGGVGEGGGAKIQLQKSTVSW